MQQDLAFLPFALPDIDQAEINEVVDSLRSGWVTTGTELNALNPTSQNSSAAITKPFL